MKAGIIGVPSEGHVDSVDYYRTSEAEFGMEFETALTALESESLEGNTLYVEGEALVEEHEKVTQFEIEDDDDDGDGFKIRSQDRNNKVQTRADYVAIEARQDHDGFVVVGSSDAEFIFDIVAEQAADGTSIKRSAVRLGSFLTSQDNFSVESGGIYNLPGQAETVMTYGDDITEDDVVGDAVQQQAAEDKVNVLAGEYNYNGTNVHLMLAETGYVNIYEPDWSTHEFLTWAESELMPHVIVPE